MIRESQCLYKFLPPRSVLTNRTNTVNNGRVSSRRIRRSGMLYRLSHVCERSAERCAIPRWLPRTGWGPLANHMGVIVEEGSSGPLPRSLASQRPLPRLRYSETAPESLVTRCSSDELLGRGRRWMKQTFQIRCLCSSAPLAHQGKPPRLKRGTSKWLSIIS